MIVDCHTHIWSDPSQLGKDAEDYLRRQTGQDSVPAGPRYHAEAAQCVDKTLVMGFISRHLAADVPNEMVAEHVAAHDETMIGIAAVDPTTDDAIDGAKELLDRPEFRGLTISPAAQNFNPTDSRAMKLYELADERGAPIFFSHGTHFPAKGSMGYARPLLLDEVAQEYPTLTMVISSLGHPWLEEGIALVGKHKRVYGDIAALIRRPWEAYNALVLAHQFNVMDKVLFGSDFPYSTAEQAIERVYRLHEVTQGTNLPSVPRETLRSMIERNTLMELGIALAGEKASEPAEQQPVTLEDDEL